MDNFSIYETETPTNENLTITFTPDTNIRKYTYRIYNNDEVISSVTINDNRSVDITLDDTGRYKITVEAFNGIETKVYQSGLYIIDKVAPEIKVISSNINMRIRDELDVNKGVKAKDNYDGDILDIKSNINELNLKELGTKNLVYTVSDKAGNTAYKTVSINVIKDNTSLIATVQIIFIIIVLLIINRTSMYLHSIILEKRYAKYAIEENSITGISLFDIVKKFYMNLVKLFGEILNKSYIMKMYSKRYEKYVLLSSNFKAIEIFANKFIIAFIFLLIALVSKVVQYKTINFYELVIPYVFGFFTLDVIYIFSYKIYREKIENDLLQAVIIMNNAFKSGRSIVQAIDLVGEELPGIIGNQFKIMRRELAKGLSVDVVFDRFSSRINVDEVNYLTASLTILNKTGGNIIKVFTTIENSLFMKKKLRLEMNSLTSSSKVIMWVLFLVPIAYIFLITLLNPSYFDVFFNTSIGIVLSAIAIIFYIIYIVVVRKILKVRM